MGTDVRDGGKLRTMRIVSWNMRGMASAWSELFKDGLLDVALLQEARIPPVHERLHLVEPARDSPCRWTMAGWKRAFRTAVAQLSDRVTMRGLPTATLESFDRQALAVSRPGTLALAAVTHGSETITCISAYAVWENMRHDTPRKKPAVFSDGSAHRLISDISPLITNRRHKVLMAGDFNLMYGYGENGDAHWAGRYESVFARMKALGLRFVGPQLPNGRQAEPWPAELPRDSKNVPTFRTSRQARGAETRQLDFVFASESIADRVHVQALNSVEDWGPSDHCRLVIDVAM